MISPPVTSKPACAFTLSLKLKTPLSAVANVVSLLEATLIVEKLVLS